MQIEFSDKNPLIMPVAAMASQELVAAAQTLKSPVGVADTVLMEDTYGQRREGSSERHESGVPRSNAVQISVSKETGLQIKIVDPDTKEVVREIPPEELQKQMAAIRGLSGMLFNRRM